MFAFGNCETKTKVKLFDRKAGKPAKLRETLTTGSTQATSSLRRMYMLDLSCERSSCSLSASSSRNMNASHSFGDGSVAANQYDWSSLVIENNALPPYGSGLFRHVSRIRLALSQHS